MIFLLGQASLTHNTVNQNVGSSLKDGSNTTTNPGGIEIISGDLTLIFAAGGAVAQPAYNRAHQPAIHLSLIHI